MTLPNLCIVLEFAAHGGLDGVLHPKRGAKGAVRLETQTRLRMALSIARGLAYLHASDPPFIHRDLKPANCFVFEDPTVVKVGCVADAGPSAARVLSAPHISCILATPNAPVLASDFGLSRFKDTSATMTAVGTPLYIAPEIWNRKQYDESVDMCVDDAGTSAIAPNRGIRDHRHNIVAQVRVWAHALRDDDGGPPLADDPRLRARRGPRGETRRAGDGHRAARQPARVDAGNGRGARSHRSHCCSLPRHHTSPGTDTGPMIHPWDTPLCNKSRHLILSRPRGAAAAQCNGPCEMQDP